MMNGRHVPLLVFALATWLLGGCMGGCKAQPADPSAPAARPAPPAPAVAERPAKPTDKAALDALKCPSPWTAQSSAAREGTRVSCFDAEGMRQGPSLLIGPAGGRLQATSFKDDREHGQLTLWQRGTKQVIARGQVEGGRLLSYEVVGDPPPLGMADGSLAPLKRRIEAEIDRAQTCQADADCTVAFGGRCPFGCAVPTHKSEAARIKELVYAAPTGCKYKCKAGKRAPGCVQGRCQTVHH
jgi:hypothetical protein